MSLRSPLSKATRSPADAADVAHLSITARLSHGNIDAVQMHVQAEVKAVGDKLPYGPSPRKLAASAATTAAVPWCSSAGLVSANCDVAGGGPPSLAKPSCLGVIMQDEPPLQPLRIPGGWHVAHNTWCGVDPEQPGSRDWLDEDLLQLTHVRCNLLVDVGWYGTGEASTFGAVVYRGSFHGELLAEFRSRVLLDVVSTVEAWLQVPHKLSNLKGITE